MVGHVEDDVLDPRLVVTADDVHDLAGASRQCGGAARGKLIGHIGDPIRYMASWIWDETKVGLLPLYQKR